MTLRSRWRESFTGRIPCGNTLSLSLMPQRYPTEREMKAPARLRFYAEHPDDCGKTVFMEARMRNKVQRLSFELSSDAWVQSVDPVHDIHNVVLPADLRGPVTIATEDNYELSTYAPWERVPSYARVKINSACPANIFIQGTRAYTPVYFDPDIVEVGDPNILEFMAQYIRFNKAKDRKDQETSALALAQANKELDGLISRYTGRAIMDGPRRGVRRNGVLPGYERRSFTAAPVSAAYTGVSFAGTMAGCCPPTMRDLPCR